jgi:hypothetical protein
MKVNSWPSSAGKAYFVALIAAPAGNHCRRPEPIGSSRYSNEGNSQMRNGLASLPNPYHRRTGRNLMAANPKIVSQVELASENETSEMVEATQITRKKQLRDVLLDIFEGHEEFLGRTPD